MHKEGEFDIKKLEEINLNHSTSTRPFLIGISGGSASGKTSVSNMLFKLLGIEDCTMVSMDSYYKDIG
jgi:uridine kinase